MRSNRTSRAALAFTVALYLTGCPAPPPEVEEDTKAVTETVTEAVTAIDAFIAEQTIDKNQEGWKLRLPKPPKVGFAADKSYFWNLETNKGNIRVKLLPNVAPMHVSSTLYLTQLGFYDGVIFHRVITGFMAQGGDPTGTGRGGPGYEYAGEFDPSVKHDRPGMLSMANAGPNTDGSQFFLTFLPTPHLDGKHTIFGEVVEGMETVKTLEKLGSRRGKPSEKLFIKKATVSVESTTRTGGNQEEAATDISAAASRQTPSA